LPTRTRTPEGRPLERVLAHYRVFEQIGAGGMGTVFRAHDTRLGRDVALKRLPSQSFADESSRQRLIREARLAAALNHPNICTIHEVGEAEGEVYIAMELVRGRPLREAIPTDGLPAETSLKYGSQIAEALAHAHAQGIVHRDLKSANVVVTSEGRIKLLDFGLARRLSDEVSAESSQRTLTSPGMLVGTPHYLAPEALRGQPTDARSDLWALGVVLHEMLSGALPFAGATGFELSAAILHSPPLPLPARVPAGLRAVVLRCLAKEPAERFQSAAELRAALETLQSGAPGTRPPRAPAVRSWRVPVALGALLVVVAAAITLAWRQPWRRPELRQRQLTSNPAGRPVVAGVLSPDGKSLAVVDDSGLSLRAVETGESHPMELPEGFAFAGPFPHVSWFPDGSQLLVSGRMADGHAAVWVLPVLGGRAHKILDDAYFASVSPDGAHIAFMTRDAAGSAGISYSGPDGQDVRRVTGDDSTGTLPAWPAWSPTGRRLIYSRIGTALHGHEERLESCDLGGKRRLAFAPTTDQSLHYFTVPRWLPDGRVLFGLTDPSPNQKDMNLWSIKVDPRSGAPSGAPHRITQWQRLAFIAPSGVSTDGRRLSVSVMEYQSDCYVGRLVASDSALHEVRRLTLDDRMDVEPSWLPDGTAILFSSDRNGTYDIFRQGVEASVAEPLVTGPGDQYGPRVSPDRAWILYLDQASGARSGAGEPTRIMRVPVTGGPGQKLIDSPKAVSFRCPTAPDRPCVLCELRGDQVVFTAFDPVHGRGKELRRTNARDLPTWDLAPDGSAIAMVVEPQDTLPRIRLLSLRGAPDREVRLDRSLQIADLAWGADGRSWLIVGAGERWYLLRVDPRGRVTAMIPPQMWMYSSVASPDGKRVAFTSNTGQGNIWMLEDF
jgi:serine/threonine protein kinase/Tol biopolymer transport system component